MYSHLDKVGKVHVLEGTSEQHIVDHREGVESATLSHGQWWDECWQFMLDHRGAGGEGQDDRAIGGGGISLCVFATRLVKLVVVVVSGKQHT